LTRYIDQPEIDTIISLSKRRGFVFQSSEIYGGISSTYDFGPLGVELKRNVKDAWWRSMVHERSDVVGIDSAIIMHPKTWEASGHLENFTDPLVECTFCNHRFRSDHFWVIELKINNETISSIGIIAASEEDALLKIKKKNLQHQSAEGNLSIQTLDAIVDHGHVLCPNCNAPGGLSDPRMFNTMFKSFMGPVEDSAHNIYLRPETAQGIFVNFPNILSTTRRKLPFGIAQIGKAFRNEITPGNFIFRTREFEMMEMEFFVNPATERQWFDYWIEQRLNWYVHYGIRKENLRLRHHNPEELAHYAKGTCDIEYRYPWGWGELEGIADRTDYDLKTHAKNSNQDLTYFDDETHERYYPYVIEPSGGVDRASLAFWIDAYDEEPEDSEGPRQEKNKTRTVLKFHRDIAPIKVAILPLSRKDTLAPLVKEVYDIVRPHFTTQYDDSQSIGRRYRRQDEIGTPYCVTVDFNSLEDKQVTLRDRDTMQQIRIPIADLVSTISNKLLCGW